MDKALIKFIDLPYIGSGIDQMRRTLFGYIVPHYGIIRIADGWKTVFREFVTVPVERMIKPRFKSPMNKIHSTQYIEHLIHLKLNLK